MRGSISPATHIFSGVQAARDIFRHITPEASDCDYAIGRFEANAVLPAGVDRDQAVSSARLRPRKAPPTAPTPRIIMAQVEGSGTAAVPTIMSS